MTIVEFIEQRLSEDEAEAARYMRGFPIPGRGDSSAAQAGRRCAMIRAMLRHAKDAGEYERDVKRRHGAWTDSELAEELQVDHRIHRDVAAYWNTHPDYRAAWAPVSP